MPKTHDEIKKGLRCLSHDRTHTLPCSDCEYHGQGLPPCRTAVHEDAIALIQQLEEQNAEKDARIQQLEKRVIYLEALNRSNLSVITMQERTRDRLQEQISQLEAERDALIDAVKDWGGACATCKHYSNEPDEIPCRFCIEMHPEDEDRISHWQWRGVQKED